jgi:hypothetical protein
MVEIVAFIIILLLEVRVVIKRPLKTISFLSWGEGGSPSWFPPRIPSFIHDIFEYRDTDLRQNLLKITILDSLKALLFAVVAIFSGDGDDAILLILA